MTLEIDNAKAVHDTGKALLVEAPEFEGSGEFIPHSQIDENSEVYKVGHKGTLVVSDWFAREIGWI